MPGKQKIGWRLLGMVLLMAALCVLPAGAEARSAAQKLNYFQTYDTTVEGQPALRIEIGMQPGRAQYTVAEQGKQLVIDLPNTRRGKLRKDIGIKSQLVNKVRIEEPERRHTVIKVNAVNSLYNVDKSKAYRVTTLEADRRQGIPWRLAIEVMKPLEMAKIPGVAGRTIVIDPGHGGSDSGARGASGVLEKDVTLSVSQKLRQLLENSGAHVVMTREMDRDVYGPNASDDDELQARIDVGLHTPGAKAFVCVHCNAFSSPSANGVETYYYAPSTESYRLAKLMDEELVAKGGLKDRGTKTARFYVLRHAGTLPATLVELGFLTNPQEEQLLADSSFQMKMAEALAQGLGRFFSPAAAHSWAVSR